jgi:lysozyme
MGRSERRAPSLALVLAFAVCLGSGVASATSVVPEQLASGRALAPKPGAVPAPPGQVPGCDASELAELQRGRGGAGVCAPRARLPLAPRAPTGQTGPDTSNNDPIYDWKPVRAHGHLFAWTKLIQGTGFIDATAAAQVAGMRRAGILAGGYDLFEVCVADPRAEAADFARRLRALGLISGSLLPIGDAERPLSVPCSVSEARRWIWTWVDEIHRLTGRWPGIYTGAWWWNPEVGCWWPPHAVSWISGYGPFPPFLPCGLRHLGVWQYTDRGFNGSGDSDMDLLFVPLAEISEPTRRELQERLWRDYRYRSALRLLLTAHHCRRPPWPQPSPDTRAYRTACALWLEHGKNVNADIRHLHAKGLF